MNETVQDERLVIDFALGQCDSASAEQVRQRLANDPEFSQIHQGVSRTLAVLRAAGDIEPPANLTERTMARVKAMRKTEALVSAPQLRRRAWTPTFSLRELTALAAAAVIVIGLMVPTLRHAQRQSQRDLCAANMGQIGTALSRYANQHDDAYPVAMSSLPVWLASAGQKAASNSSALFQLVADSLAQPEVFQCPCIGGKSFVFKQGMVDFPYPKTIGYSYQYSLDSPIRRTDPALAGVAAEMAILADSNPVFRDGRFDASSCTRSAVSRNHAEGGQNVLYLDGHVAWTDNCNVGVKGDNIWLAQNVYNYKGDERPGSPTDSFLLPNAGE